jgi:hypothetical protein
MKTGHKIVALGCLAVAVGSVACWRWSIRMPLREFTRYALYMAVLDDEICRNELEGNLVGDTVIVFPPREESLQERYHLFLEMNRTKSRRQLQAEIADMEQRLQESRQYIGQPKGQLEIEIVGENDM